eukprot:SAG31_NODE_435_length_15733_cov_6.508251_9_plen_57_part_00
MRLGGRPIFGRRRPDIPVQSSNSDDNPLRHLEFDCNLFCKLLLVAVVVQGVGAMLV